MRQTEALRRKRAELASSTGAGVLGMGVGTLLAHWMSFHALPMVVVGVLLHGWGMLERHRLDRAVEMPLWSRALFWLCWIVLAILMIWIGLRALTG
jgi:uncharacterized membrane protein YecN with MAPEG domain